MYIKYYVYYMYIIKNMYIMNKYWNIERCIKIWKDVCKNIYIKIYKFFYKIQFFVFF